MQFMVYVMLMIRETSSKLLIYLLSGFMLLSFPLGLYATKLSEEDADKKKEGWYPFGIPLVKYSSDDGFGYGLRMYLYNNGHKQSEFFDTAPYFLQIYAQYYATTNNYYYHELNLDMPYVAGTRFRVRSALIFEKEINANYFGTGADAARSKLTSNYADGNKTYNTYSGYKNNFLDEYNKQYLKWNNYTITKPRYNIYLFRNIITEEILLMGGLEISRAFIDTWDGRKVDKKYYQQESKLSYDNSINPITGFKGGWSNLARFGAGFDTRDFEPDPKKGIYLDYCFEISDKALGSDYNFTKNNLTAQFYTPVIPSIVLAFRLAYTAAAGNIPFYEANWFGFSMERKYGLGGNWTLRGNIKDRYVGKVMTLGNAEIRWQFYEFVGTENRYNLKLVAFYDAGNVYDNAFDPVAKPRLTDYHHSAGCGLIFGWNLSTIIHLYFGFSRENMGIFLNFSHSY